MSNQENCSSSCWGVSFQFEIFESRPLIQWILLHGTIVGALLTRSEPEPNQGQDQPVSCLVTVPDRVLVGLVQPPEQYGFKPMCATAIERAQEEGRQLNQLWSKQHPQVGVGLRHVWLETNFDDGPKMELGLSSATVRRT